MLVFQGVDDLPGGSGHFEGGEDAIEGLEAKTAGTVAAGLPAGAAVRAATGAGCGFHGGLARGTQERAKAATVYAAQRVEEVEGCSAKRGEHRESLLSVEGPGIP